MKPMPDAMPYACEYAHNVYVTPGRSALSCALSCGGFDAQGTGGDHPRSLLGGGVRRTSSKVHSMHPILILQEYLDHVGTAVMSERFEDYAARIELPLRILTSSANISVASREDLEDGFNDFCEMLQSLGVSQMVRKVIHAGFQGTDHIVGVYETRLMDGARQALPTFHSKMWIGIYDGTWKAIKIHNTTNDARWPMLLTRLAAKPWPHEEL